MHGSNVFFRILCWSCLCARRRRWRRGEGEGEDECGPHLNPFTTYMKAVGGRYTHSTKKEIRTQTQPNAISHADLMMKKYEALKATVGPLDSVKWDTHTNSLTRSFSRLRVHISCLALRLPLWTRRACHLFGKMENWIFKLGFCACVCMQIYSGLADIHSSAILIRRFCDKVVGWPECHRCCVSMNV